MYSSIIQVSYPSDADIESATTALLYDIPSDLIRPLFLLQGIPEDHRTRIIEAVQAIPEGQREHLEKWLQTLSTWKATTRATPLTSTPNTRDSYSSDAQASRASASSFAFSHSSSSSAGHARDSVAIGTLKLSRMLAQAQKDSASNALPLPCPGKRESVPTHTVTASNTSGQFVPHRTPGSFNSSAYLKLAPRPQRLEQPEQDNVDQMVVSSPMPGKLGKTETASNTGNKTLAKYLCPVCAKGYTRPADMKKHANNRCLKPKRYACSGCDFTSPVKTTMEAHCKVLPQCSVSDFSKYSVSKRSHASCVTGRVSDNPDDLIEDARNHCRSSVDIPASSQDLRLKALLSEVNNKALNEEIKAQCQAWTQDPMRWQQLTWPKDVALRHADMIEYGLQSDESPIKGADKSNQDGLLKYGLGIADMRQFVFDVLQTSQPLTFAGLSFEDQQYQSPNMSNSVFAQSDALPMPSVTSQQPCSNAADPGVSSAKSQVFHTSDPFQRWAQGSTKDYSSHQSQLQFFEEQSNNTPLPMRSAFSGQSNSNATDQGSSSAQIQDFTTSYPFQQWVQGYSGQLQFPEEQGSDAPLDENRQRYSVIMGGCDFDGYTQANPAFDQHQYLGSANDLPPAEGYGNAY